MRVSMTYTEVMRDSRRPRRAVSAMTFVLLRPLLRYSAGRDAYVLRGVGHRWGPVLVRNTGG
jgi:hypothetical protein